MHAAGLILSNEPITNVTAVLEREIKGNVVQVVSLDKYDAERQGLLKMDFLGLSTMSMIWEALRYLGMHPQELYDLPLEDERVYEGFMRNDVVGVFQFDGRAMRYVCGALKPERFSEVMDCNALARPGPLHNGAAREYVNVKHGDAQPEKVHPAIDEYTEPTKYQIVYQEQILNICRYVGDFGWTQVADIRRIISRKKGEQAFNRERDRFIRGCTHVHERRDVPPMSEDLAAKIWGSMITAGAYAFNAAHCASYGLLAYWTMWLKTYHPEVFYACSLAQTGDKDRTRELLRDAHKHEVVVKPSHPKHSEVTWKPLLKKKRPTIRAGFSQVEGIGERTSEDILAYRAENGLTSWDDLLAVKGIGPKKIESIRAWVGNRDPFNAFLLDENIDKVKRMLDAGQLGEGLPIPTHTATQIPTEIGREFAVVWLGTVLTRNVRDIFEQNRSRTGEELDRNKVKAPELNEWIMMTAEDEDDRILLSADRFKYPMFKDALFSVRMGVDLVLVEGIRPRYASTRQVKIKKLWVIDPTE